MKLMIDIDIPGAESSIKYGDKIMLMGSCFTENIGVALEQVKFDTLQNPNGILYDPVSLTDALVSYTQNRKYKEDDLYFHDELWHSWRHHGRFSGPSQSDVLETINSAQANAHIFLQQASWLFITFGTSFSYRLVSNNQPVANCHKVPSAMFRKHLMTIEETCSVLDNCIHQLFRFNPNLRIVFTVSPVRHIRDGIVQNNLSKARLLESCHHLANKFDRLYYFPAYELVIDVLRDYRFYQSDLVHPSTDAIQYVFERFAKSYLDPAVVPLMEELKQINAAYSHRPIHEAGDAHQHFLRKQYEKVLSMKNRYPNLDLDRELSYFNTARSL